MQDATLLMVIVMGLFMAFRAVTSAIEVAFKVVIVLIILSFLGYSFVGWEDINLQPVTPLMNEINSSPTGYLVRELPVVPLERQEAIPNTKPL